MTYGTGSYGATPYGAGDDAGLTLYWAIQPSGTANWANNATGGGYIRDGKDGTGSALSAGSYGSQAYTAAGQIDMAVAASGLTPGQSYEFGFVLYDPAAGEYSNVQVSAALRTAYLLSAASGTFSYSGDDAGLAFNRVLVASGGTFSHTGGDATFTYTPISGDDYTLACASGTFSYTGGAAGLAFNRVLSAASGTFSYSGGDVRLARGWTLAAASGTFSYSGGDASFLRTYVLSAGGGSFSFTGGDATFTYSGAPVVIEPPKQPGGGKSRKPRKRRLQVEIDGDVFDVESEEEAEAVLEKAAKEATETAKIAIERAAKAKRRPVRKIVRDAEKALTVPDVAVSPSLQSYADQMIGKIRAEYQSALSAIEIAAHRAQREREIEEDDEDVLMLL